jgi:hypothetical protein
MDPFAILGISRDASGSDITRAFKRLAHRHHPDRNPGDPDAPARFRRIHEAYEAARAERARDRDVPRPVTRSSVDELEKRARRLADCIDAVRSSRVTNEALETLLDAARWTRLHVDFALAFQRQVHPLTDAAWSARRFTTERAAMATIVEFRDRLVPAPASAMDLAGLRNLRARLDGLMAVVDGWAKRTRSRRA